LYQWKLQGDRDAIPTIFKRVGSKLNKIILLLFVSVIASETFGCSYPNFTAELAIEKADKVFIGQAIKAEISQGQGWVTRFKVLKPIKGSVDSEEAVPIADNNCGRIKYALGHKYIVLLDQQNQVSDMAGHEKYYPASESPEPFESSKLIRYLRSLPGFDW
jgi:hypothetical protein